MHNPNLESELAALIASLPTRSEIYLPTSKISLADQLDGLRRVKSVYETGLDEIYRPALLALREKYAGTKRAFIIGNGPSLNDTDLSLLEDEVTFCVNGFFLKMPELGWEPTFYMVEDHLVAEDRAEAINALSGPLKLFPAYLAYCINPADDVVFFNHRPRKSYPHGFDFTDNAAEVTYTGCTVTFTAMQLAHWMGIEEIYLIGVDASYSMPEDVQQSDQYGVGVLDMSSDDPNHFHPDYFGKGYRWHDPQVEKMIEAYSEARVHADRSGRPILNATVGGELEVFQRVDYASLFPAASSKPAFPRVVVVDMTPPGDGTATGNLKQNLFQGWPAGQIMYCTSHNTRRLELHFQAINENLRSEAFLSADAAVEAIKVFSPDIILYRPVPEKPMLHTVVKRVIADGYPYAIWIMDDWLARAATDEEEPNVALRDEVEKLILSSSLNLSISDAMSAAYLDRYGVEFSAVANGVAEAEWPEHQLRSDESVLIRYAGGLAPDMSLESVLNLAKAIEQTSRSSEMTLEINTRRHWFDRYASLFRNFNKTTISCSQLSDQAYRKWMTEADINVIAYNFDDVTISYTQFSMANKLPECLASGATTLAIGPAQSATIAAAENARVDLVVTSPGVEPIAEALKSYLTNRLEYAAQAVDVRRTAFKRYSITRSQDVLRQKLVAASGARTGPASIHLRSWSAYREYLLPRSFSLEKTSSAQNGLVRRSISACKRLASFYNGWRGGVASAAVLAAALPAVEDPGSLVSYGPAIAIGLLLLLIGHVSASILASLK